MTVKKGSCPQVRYTTTLPADIVDALREIGSGNASEAIIMLVKASTPRSRLLNALQYTRTGED